ncbi:substrate-binding domain-containing protein [bacterium]|nr:substrate-binding domain-containing protein [bacterium]
MLLIGGLTACSKESAETGQGEDSQAQATPAAESFEIAVIPKGTAHPFWKAVHAGAEKAGQEAGAKIFWTGAENEDDRNQQIEVVRNFISRGVDAIVLAPLDDTALVRPVEEAIRRNIPVVIIDSDLKSEAYSSFVATDNFEGGRLAARRLAQVLDMQGRILMLRYSEGSASTRNREDGFLAEMKEDYPEIELVSTNQYAGVTKESAYQASQNMLNKYPDISGVFTPNESSSFGMLRALETSGKKPGTIKFVGFDASEGLLEGLREGYIQGLVAQDPFQMGYKGVLTAVQVLKGETVEKRIPTRLLIVTDENMENPDVIEVIRTEAERSRE